MRMHLVPQTSLVEARGSQRGPGIAMRIHAHLYSPAGDTCFLQVSSVQGEAARPGSFIS